MLNRMLLLLTLIGLTLAPAACKKAGKKSKGSSKLTSAQISGAWASVASKKGSDETKYDDANGSVIEFAGDKFSSFGKGPLSTSCAELQSYVLDGKMVRVAKSESCGGQDFQVVEVKGDSLAADHNGTRHTFTKVNKARVLELLAANGFSASNVPAPFSKYYTAADPADPSTPPTDGGSSQYDALAWSALADYKLVVRQNTTPEQLSAPRVGYLYFQNNAPVVDTSLLKKASGDVYCQVQFRLGAGPEESILQTGQDILFWGSWQRPWQKIPFLEQIGDTVGYAYPTSAHVSKQIDCTKFSNESVQLTFGDLRRAMGSYVSIEKP